MYKNTKYSAAVKRNLYEIAHALFELKALTVFEDYIRDKELWIQGESFFSISNRALFNDMMAHAMKVLEMNKSKDSTTFWYLLKKDPKKIKGLKSFEQNKINFLENIASKLKIIRDKTHFHIDRKGVLDPSRVWKEADIRGKDLAEALQYLFVILSELYQLTFNKGFLFHPDDYVGKDLVKLLDLANTNNLIEIIPKVDAE